MKKLLTLTAIACSTLALTGCTDATAKLSDANTQVLKVGDTVVTKGEIYSSMFASAGQSIAYFNAMKEITANEVEVTDEMRETAESTLSYYQLMYGDTFTSYLESAGLTEEDYINDNLIPSLQANELVGKYIEENYDSLTTEYNPIQATVLAFSTLDNANAALSALNDGSSTAEEVAVEYESSTTGTTELITINTTSYDSELLTVIRSNSPDDGWTFLNSSDETTYYLVRVEDNNPENYKEDVISTLSAITAISDASTSYYFEKYNFVIYDIDLYNAMVESAPNAVVQ